MPLLSSQSQSFFALGSNISIHGGLLLISSFAQVYPPLLALLGYIWALKTFGIHEQIVVLIVLGSKNIVYVTSVL